MLIFNHFLKLCMCLPLTLHFLSSASSDDDLKQIEFASKVRLISRCISLLHPNSCLQIKRVGDDEVDETALRKKRLES